jgi:hypothetical protein
MSIATKTLADIADTDIAGLAGTAPDAQRIAVLGAWSKVEGAAAIASLANTAGGLVVVGASLDAAGKLALNGTNASEADLAAAAADLGADARHLAQVRVIEVAGKRIGLIGVAETGSPPVVVETDGAIFVRNAAGAQRVLTRAGLDELVEKDHLLRDRAETNIDGMIGRVAFGHFNYMTVAVVAAPRIASAEPYRWATANKAALVDQALGLAKRWGLQVSNVNIGAGEVEVALPAEITGFIRVARNGCIAVGERSYRPPQDSYLAPAELAARLAEMTQALTVAYESTRVGKVVTSLFLESVRDLRLPVEDGLTAPVKKDLIQEFVSERFLDSAEERAALARDIQAAAGEVFGADLVAGSGQAYTGPIKDAQPKNWHGITKRTERRLSGARGHGSAR